MAMYNFRLQTVLDVKKIFEDKALAEFSEQQRELQKEKDALKKIEEQKIKLINAVREIQGKSVNIYEIILKSSDVKQCRKKEVEQCERVSEAGRKVDEKREELLEASKNRKMMEILKTKDFDKFQADANLLERTSIDEMAIVRHNRKEKT
jgi:flagellar FliJ protein